MKRSLVHVVSTWSPFLFDSYTVLGLINVSPLIRHVGAKDKLVPRPGEGQNNRVDLIATLHLLTGFRS